VGSSWKPIIEIWKGAGFLPYNIGQIPNFEKLIATIRSRNISATIILQAFAQLKDIYKDKANIIDGNCDTSIF
jgi:type IV secretion system protein VirD4